METTKKTFEQYELNPGLVQSLSAAGFTNPSPVQEVTIEPIISGEDIFAQAETGSGKTGSFAIPIIEKLLRAENMAELQCQYVVLSPTRELAQQTTKVFKLFGDSLGINVTCVIGGEDIEKQKKNIEKGTHVLVATPGRMGDLLKQKIANLSDCKGVVFDEADRLFDMGFKKDIEFILSKVPKSRQLIMVSATSHMDVITTAYKFHSKPVEFKLNEDSLLVDHINHQLAMVSREEKMPLLVNLLRKHEDAYAIVFCNTQFQTHSVAEWLKAMGFKAKPISGRLPQNKRTRLMEEFRAKEVTILVCTDVAARGLDIKDVNFVVNYDLPQEAANYVHRIGRTGRAGAEGEAISLCAYEDCEYLDPIYEYIDAKIPKMDLEESDFATDLCKKPYIDAKTLRVSDGKKDSHRKDKRYDKKAKDAKKDYKNKKRDKSSNKTNVTAKASFKPKHFEIVSNNEMSAKSSALEYFNLKDDGLLAFDVLEKSRKKYFLFGPRTIKYKFFIRPIFKRLLTPYFREIIKKSSLKLDVRVSFKRPYVNVYFSGKDEELLKNNNNELLYAFDQIAKTYLSQKIEMRGYKLSTRCSNRSENGEDRLIKLANKMKKKVLTSKKPVLLKSLSPADRRIIHQHLSEDKEVKTTSLGEGRFKQIEISIR